MKNNRFYSHKLRICTCMFTFVLLFSNIVTVYADAPFESYSYDFWGDDVVQPPAYLHTATIDTETIGTALNYAEDMFLFEDKIYIADTMNSRILKLDKNGQTELVIDSFIKDGKRSTFLEPRGIFITEEGHIYIADSGNGRIIELEADGSYIREIGRPVTDLITAKQKYIPTKVVVDKAGRIYTLCYGINMGMVEFNKNGEFQGFMGATKVSVNAFDYIWKNYFSTKAQQQRMETIIPTEYSNIFIDQENFVYATIGNLSAKAHRAGAEAIRRLNPTGTDILRRLGNYPIIGDLYDASETASWSKFVDISATDYGCYFALDSAGGKVFAYDYDGNSLFIFGSLGNREGNVQKPVAIGVSEDESTIYILDSLLNSVLVYEITEYGQHLLSALEKNSMGDSEGSYQEWLEVLRHNANSEFAYIGIGKTFLKEGEYKEAMDYFQLGNSRKYYTKSFKFYRKELMQENFGRVMGVVSIIVLILVLLGFYKKIKRWVGEK